MFLGHLAVGFAAKRAAPRAGLAPLMAAPVLLDLLWPLFVLLGLEEVRIEPGATAVTPLDFASYPFSHSLAFAALWAAIFGGAYLVRTRYRAGALVAAGGVLSHWALVLFAAATFAANLLGPPPPSPRAIAWAGLAQWLWVPWAALIDRHRVLRDGVPLGALAA